MCGFNCRSATFNVRFRYFHRYLI
nr:hypothetical protein [Staphylococcus xylosus]